MKCEKIIGVSFKDSKENVLKQFKNANLDFFNERKRRKRKINNFHELKIYRCIILVKNVPPKLQIVQND